MIKRFKNRKLSSPNVSKKSTGSYVLQDSQTCNAIEKMRPPVCSPLEEIILNGSCQEINANAKINKWLDSPFLQREVALQTAKVRSSPRLNRIGYKILQILPESFEVLLLAIINNLFNNGVFPKDWTHSLVYLIPKPQGGEMRLIALTSCVLKIAEKMVLNRLQWVIESGVVLPEHQFGFRKTRLFRHSHGGHSRRLYEKENSGRSIHRHQERFR